MYLSLIWLSFQFPLTGYPVCFPIEGGYPLISFLPKGGVNRTGVGASGHVDETFTKAHRDWTAELGNVPSWTSQQNDSFLANVNICLVAGAHRREVVSCCQCLPYNVFGFLR
jgi:hypothetical protein